MIDILVSSTGSMTTTPILKRDTKLKAIVSDCFFHLETLVSLDSKLVTSYQSDVFVDLIGYTQTDTAYFLSFELSERETDIYYLEKHLSKVEDEVFCKYLITIKKEFFSSINIVHYKKSVKKLIKQIIGV